MKMFRQFQPPNERMDVGLSSSIAISINLSGRYLRSAAAAAASSHLSKLKPPPTQFCHWGVINRGSKMSNGIGDICGPFEYQEFGTSFIQPKVER